jgi:hypothetical protein
MGRDIEFLQEKAVTEVRAREVGVEDREAREPAVLFRHEAERSAVRHGVSVVVLVLLQETGKCLLVVV